MKKSLIPKKYLIEGQHYWCARDHHATLYLMRYDKGRFYSIPDDVFWPSESIRVMFVDYEH